MPTPRAPSEELRSLGDYRLLRRLGEGGMGSVYLGYHEGQKRQVAIKVLSDHLAGNPGYIARFYREARSSAGLNHPNIVRGLSVDRDGVSGKHYLVLEFVDGTSAHALLDRAGRLPVGDAVAIALDVARALEHAHSRKIIHRDIKPDNILLTRSGVARLADFGLSKRTDEPSHLTTVRQGFGTSYYMPYEQALNARMADGRSDLYALGATLYHLLAGQVPFGGDNHLEVVEKKGRGEYPPASSLNGAVPAELDRILDKLLAREPDARYQTASELIVDLERSRLASALPSYADPEQALQDPYARARLTTVAQPTRLDLDNSNNKIAVSTPAEDARWRLRYRNGAGKLCHGQGTTDQVARRLKRGRLPAGLEACRGAGDGFRPVDEFPEFAGLRRRKARKPVASGDVQAATKSTSRFSWPWVCVGAAGLVLAGAGVALARWLL
jgi:serine/threonine-protein kinase